MANRHLIKLWFLTLLIAPFVYGIYNYIVDVERQIVALFEVLPIILLFSFAFSLPTLLIAFLTNKLITNKKRSIRNQKILNILIAAVGLTCTLLIIKGSLIPTLIGTYIISLLISAITLEIYAEIKHI